MLIIKTRREETVRLGSGKIKVLDVGPGWVKLGFDFPRETKIMREELLARENHTLSRCCRCNCFLSTGEVADSREMGFEENYCSRHLTEVADRFLRALEEPEAIN